MESWEFGDMINAWIIIVFDAQWIRIRNPLHDTTMFVTRRPNVDLRVPRELFASKTQPPDINARTGRSGQWQDHEWPFCANNSAWSMLLYLKMFDVRRWSLVFGIDKCWNHGVVEGDWWWSSESSIALAGSFLEILFVKWNEKWLSVWH